jgi:mannose-6-phosphate isomerase-like protein (cupin superfamily)
MAGHGYAAPRMNEGVTVTRLEMDTPDRFVSLRRALGVSSFGINLMTLRPGERGRIHRHEHQEEVYLVLRGVLGLEVEGEEREIAAGEAVRVAPEVRRRVLNRGPETVVLVALGGSGDHVGRDGVAYAAWEDQEGAPPQEIPLPEDLPASELRSA